LRCYASHSKRGGYSMRISALLTITLAVSVFVASCGGQQTSVEKAEEESSVEETTVEETTAEETNSQAEATVEETTAAEVAVSESAPEAVPEAVPEPSGSIIAPQEEEEINVSPDEVNGEQEQAQTQEGINVAQAAAPDPATVGSPLTFTVTVTNNSSTQHVGFKDFLPPSMTFVSATPSQGFCGPPHHGANLFDCTLGVIPTGDSVSVEVVAIPTAAGTMTNTAQAGGGFAPVTSVPASVTVNAQPG
jgi:uncharacterized repeat protein (TIGR01451 family)